MATSTRTEIPSDIGVERIINNVRKEINNVIRIAARGSNIDKLALLMDPKVRELKDQAGDTIAHIIAANSDKSDMLQSYIINNFAIASLHGADGRSVVSRIFLHPSSKEMEKKAESMLTEKDKELVQQGHGPVIATANRLLDMVR